MTQSQKIKKAKKIPIQLTNIAGNVVLKKTPIKIDDVSSDPRFSTHKDFMGLVNEIKINNVLATPIFDINNKKVLGVI